MNVREGVVFVPTNDYLEPINLTNFPHLMSILFSETDDNPTAWVFKAPAY
jgi:hypothetical protein